MEGLSWINCLILITWQKIAPIIILSYYFNIKFLFFIIILSRIIGAIGGLNQISLRKIIAFSSINHIRWIIISIIIREFLWNLYFFIYTLLIIVICIIFFSLNCFFLNQLFFNNINSIIKLFIFLNFLSLGGLPPFLGFFPKWIVINYLIQNNIIFICLIFLISTLITLFFYIRITYSAFIFNYSKLKWYNFYFKNNLFNKINIITFFSLNSLILRTFILFIF